MHDPHSIKVRLVQVFIDDKETFIKYSLWKKYRWKMCVYITKVHLKFWGPENFCISVELFMQTLFHSMSYDRAFRGGATTQAVH